ASVSFDGEDPVTVSDLYDAALTDSSNDAYDALVEIAGVDWLNSQFLTADRGFPDTVIQRSYVEGGAITSPPMTITENGRSVDLPERDPTLDLGVPNAGNRSNLYEMADAVSRIVQHETIPVAQRFRITDADADGMRAALLAAEGFIAPGIQASLGS